MKFKFLKKAAAFVMASVMAVGTLAVLPEECLPEFGIVASAVELTTSQTRISTSDYHSAYITNNGDLYTWGRGFDGALGNGSETDSSKPIKIMSNVVSVCCSGTVTAAITTNGDLYTWGGNYFGNLGDGTNTDRSTPVKIMSNVVSVSCGGNHTAAITSNGDLYTWGYNKYGALGDGTTLDKNIPVKIMSNVVEVSCGSGHTAAITSNGDLYTWGYNGAGQLGKSSHNGLSPEKIMSGVASISMGNAYSGAITTDGDLYVWGNNHYGQIGDGSTTTKFTPVKIMSNVTAVSCGTSHTGAITTNGDLYTWGYNENGSIGDGTTVDKHTPQKILGNVAAVNCGGATLAISNNGGVYSWGKNESGQLGDGTTVNRNVPNQIFISDNPDGSISYNGHRYKLFDESMTWTEAKAYCENLGGHLVTINSAGEQSFITSLTNSSSKKNIWLGAELVNNNYVWITNEEFSYTNWASGEPNNVFGMQNTIMMYTKNGNDTAGTWNDESKEGRNWSGYRVSETGFVCEWDSDSSAEENGFSSSRDGWCLVNTNATFGYSDNYRIPIKRYYETYGINLSSTVIAAIQDLPKWGGNCFGLSILSIAEYNKQIDLQSYFPTNGNGLYYYGYNNIGQDDKGQYFNIENNYDAITAIERAQISQESQEIKKSEVFANDNTYSKLLEHLYSQSPNPLLVTLFSGSGGHTVVIRTDEKPCQLSGESSNWYYIPLYDCNAPSYSSKLQSPYWWYTQTIPYLLVNTKTGEWQYWRNNTLQMKNSYSFLWDKNICFYDISKLGTEYFNSSLTLWGTLIKLKFSASDLEIKDKDGNFLFIASDNTIKYVSEDCTYVPNYEDVETTDSQLSGTLELNSEQFWFCSEKSEILIISKENIISMTNDNSVECEVCIPENTITAQSIQESSISLAVQNGVVDGSVPLTLAVYSELNDAQTLDVKINNNIGYVNTDDDIIADITLENDTKIKNYNDVKINLIDEININTLDIEYKCFLTDILLNDVSIVDFSSDKTDYTVTLPYGTIAIPTVTATPANANADVDIAQATSLTGTELERTATITVTAEDGVTKTIYKVVFSIETHTHILATEYSSYATGHWYACSGCVEKIGFEAHTEDSGTVTTEPTETNEGIKTFKCTKCDYVIRTEPIAVLAHTHTLATNYSSDATGHWYTCSGCDEKIGFETHTEDSGTVTTVPTETTEGVKTFKCTKCKFVLRTEPIPPITPDHIHNYDAEWKSDSTSHWHECDCGEKVDSAYHISDNGVVTLQPTETSEGIMTYSCSICGYILRTEKIPANTPEHTHSYGTVWKSDSTSHWHECSCGDKSNIGQHISNGGIVTVQPTATSTGLKVYSCSVCGYGLRMETIPATGYNDYPSYPSYPTYPFDSSIFNVVTFTDKVIVTAETEGNTVTLKWDKVEKADKYYVYQYKNGKYVKVKTTANTSATFKKLKNGETYKFLVRYTKSGRLSPTKYSGTISVKVYYKPIPKPTATKNSIKLTWEAVPEAEKYAVYKYVDGKAVKLTETKKLSVKIGKLITDTEYKYIVRAYVDGKWTTMLKSDIVTVKTKAE